MGKRGPAGAPTQLRLLRGDRPSRINDREPIPRDLLPKPPAAMSAEAREIWDYTLKELVYMKTAAAADRDTLACYCEAVVTHRKATAELGQTELMVRGNAGGLTRNPMLQIQRDAAHTIRGFAQEFGLTPSARAGIKMEGPTNAGKANPFTASC